VTTIERRLPGSKPEQHTSEIQQYWCSGHCQYRHPEHLNDKVEGGDHSSVVPIDYKTDDNPPHHGSVVKLTEQPAATVPIVGDRKTI
jgi:hypothetical protein